MIIKSCFSIGHLSSSGFVINNYQVFNKEKKKKQKEKKINTLQYFLTALIFSG